MMLRAFRTGMGMGFAELARALGIGGVNPGGTLARIENGSRQPDADMVERIERFTGGAVTAADMHAVRLAWLKANRPEKFAGHTPPSVALRPAPPSGLPAISPARGEIGSCGAGDDRPALGDERPALGDERPTIGDERPTVGDPLPTADCRLPAQAARATAEAAE